MVSACGCHPRGHTIIEVRGQLVGDKARGLPTAWSGALWYLHVAEGSGSFFIEDELTSPPGKRSLGCLANRCFSGGILGEGGCPFSET